MQAERSETFIITDGPSFKANSVQGVTTYYAGIRRKLEGNQNYRSTGPDTQRFAAATARSPAAPSCTTSPASTSIAPDRPRNILRCRVSSTSANTPPTNVNRNGSAQSHGRRHRLRRHQRKQQQHHHQRRRIAEVAAASHRRHRAAAPPASPPQSARSPCSGRSDGHSSSENQNRAPPPVNT